MTTNNASFCINRRFEQQGLVTVLRALKKNIAASMSGLETSWREAAKWGEQMKGISCNSDYDVVCKAFGARLFQKSEADAAWEKAQLEGWLASRGQEDQAFHRMFKEAAEDPDEEDSGGKDDSEPWHAGGSELDEDVKETRLRTFTHLEGVQGLSGPHQGSS
jgi:hypothetical protein